MVVDTGSTDGTPDIAARLGARVLSFPWNGSFADARNFALDQARGEWALIMDADEVLHPDDGPLLRRLVAGEREEEAHIITVMNWVGAEAGVEALVDHRVSLFRRRPEYRYSGALHEQIQERILVARPGAVIAVTPLRILHYGYLDGEMARAGKRERNRRILERRLEESPGDPFLQYALGIEMMGAGELARARELLEASLAGGGLAAHFRSDLLLKLSNCARHQGDLAAARAWLEEAASEYPDFPDLWYGLAGLHAEAGRWWEAEVCLRLCLALGEAPTRYQSLKGVSSHRAWFALGQVYEARGKDRAARQAYLGCLRTDPAHREAMGRLAKLLAATSPETAVAELAAAFNLAHPETVTTLAASLRRAGAAIHAHHLLQTAHNEEPPPAFWTELARAYLAGANLVKEGGEDNGRPVPG